MGLRSLGPREKDYKPQYYGDLRSRDAAYHQGTVWAWLIGPFVDAWLKVYPDDLAGARQYLTGFQGAMEEGASADEEQEDELADKIAGKDPFKIQKRLLDRFEVGPH